MIDVKQAVAAARAFLTGIYAPRPLEDIELEEVELSEDGRRWLVTLSFLQLDPLPGGPAISVATAILSRTKSRTYKLIQVDAITGDAVSMKIRTV